MRTWREEFKLQAIFAALQSGIVIAGSLVVATLLKVRGYPEKFENAPVLAVFVRNWGFLLVGVALLWVMTTIWLERHRPAWFSKRWTILSGVVVALGLAWLFLVIAAGTSGTIIQAV